MTPTEFKDANWINRLAHALSNLAESQMPYDDELYERRRRYTDTENTSPFSHPSNDILYLYVNACSRTGNYYETHYRPLRTALDKVQSVLGEHPVFKNILRYSDDKQKFWIEIMAHGNRISLLHIAAGLMSRAEEVPNDGFMVASSELNTLLNLSKGQDPAPLPDNLNVGYNVVLFHGLHLSEKIQITDEIAIVPFDQTEAFVNKDILADIVPPDIIKYTRIRSVGAILRPFRWRPFLSSGDQSHQELDWAETFFDEAQAFIELLAIFHGAPVVYMMGIPHCVNRSASYLLGQLYYHGGVSWRYSAYALDRFAISNDLCMEALDNAKRIFQKRKSTQYKKYAHVISRLAESLTRSGQYQAEDKILDVAIALEQMYELSGGEISFKLKTRASCFLETHTEERLKVFEDVEDFYKVRSGIVHKKEKPVSAEKKRKVFDAGFKLARKSLVKLLDEETPDDWNKLVITVPNT